MPSCCRPFGNGLAVHSLFYQSEINALDLPADQIAVSAAELKLATQLVEGMAAPFNPSAYTDTLRREHPRLLVAAKASGTAPKVPVRKEAPKTNDLLAALTASVAATKQKKVA